MMELGGGCAVDNNIQRLPEECLSHAISLTSSRDACRSEAVSTAFRAAAMSDDVWKRLLPSDYAEILARAVDRMEFASMKHLYFRLCDPILIDGGKMGFSVDRETGAKCFILPARELWIVWGDTPNYWRWTSHPESRFPEVAELMNVCWLEIRGKIDSRMLSKRTNYSAYLIFKVSNSLRGFGYPLQEVLVTVGAHVSKLSVRLTESEDTSSRRPPLRPIFRRHRFLQNFLRRQNPPEDLQSVVLQEEEQGRQHQQSDPVEPPEDEVEPQHDQRVEPQEQAQDQTQRERRMVGKPQTRQDGWMEIFLGEFYNEEGDDGEVDMSLLEIKGGNWKSGLIVQGIEIRPKK